MFNAQPLAVIETNRWLGCCNVATDPRFELRNAEKLQIVVSGLREAVQCIHSTSRIQSQPS